MPTATLVANFFELEKSTDCIAETKTLGFTRSGARRFSVKRDNKNEMSDFATNQRDWHAWA
jgi:hypothetical protein